MDRLCTEDRWLCYSRRRRRTCGRRVLAVQLLKGIWCKLVTKSHDPVGTVLVLLGLYNIYFSNESVQLVHLKPSIKILVA